MAGDLLDAVGREEMSVRILKTIEGVPFAKNTTLSLANRIGISQIKMQKHLKFLVSKGYIRSVRIGLMNKDGYLLTDKCRRLLTLGYN